MHWKVAEQSLLRSSRTPRRENFPSWSWAGWKTSAQWKKWHYGEIAQRLFTSVKVESLDGTTIPWETFQTMLWKDNSFQWSSRFLVIHTWTVAVTIDLSQEVMDKPIACIGNDIYQYRAEAELLRVPERRCIGMCAVRYLDTDGDVLRANIVLLEQQEDYWEMVGFTKISPHSRDSLLIDTSPEGFLQQARGALQLVQQCIRLG